MSRFILDFSGGNTHRNDMDYLKRMMDEVKAIDTGKHEIIIKHQLFVTAGDNIPLDRKVFKEAYLYADTLGYKTTSSVFDLESLEYLLEYDIPFVKIANSRSLDYLIGEIPRKIPVYVSHSRDLNEQSVGYDELLCCISNYPATITDYRNTFLNFQLNNSISDHTETWEVFNQYKPKIYECHYKLEDSTGLDAGTFARTPAMLKEVL